jgi:hypothetical protein
MTQCGWADQFPAARPRASALTPVSETGAHLLNKWLYALQRKGGPLPARNDRPGRLVAQGAAVECVPLFISRLDALQIVAAVGFKV